MPEENDSFEEILDKAFYLSPQQISYYTESDGVHNSKYTPTMKHVHTNMIQQHYWSKPKPIQALKNRVKAMMIKDYLPVREYLLTTKELSGIRLETNGYTSCFKHTDNETNKKTILKGLHNSLAEYMFPKVGTSMQKGFIGRSSLEYGKLIDDIRMHVVDCNIQGKCICKKGYRLMSSDAVNMLTAYYQDAALMGMIPFTTQLQCFDLKTKTGTACDEIFFRPKYMDLVVVECKTGFVGPIYDNIGSASVQIKKGPFQRKPIKHSWANRHSIQAAVTAMMIENNYGTPELRVNKVMVCYLHRENLVPSNQLHLLWTDVTEAEWFDTPEKRQYFWSEWSQSILYSELGVKRPRPTSSESSPRNEESSSKCDEFISESSSPPKRKQPTKKRQHPRKRSKFICDESNYSDTNLEEDEEDEDFDAESAFLRDFIVDDSDEESEEEDSTELRKAFRSNYTEERTRSRRMPRFGSELSQEVSVLHQNNYQSTAEEYTKHKRKNLDKESILNNRIQFLDFIPFDSF